MKIVTWNVWYKECLNNLDALIEQINALDADIICLQEVFYLTDQAKNKKSSIDTLFDSYDYAAFAIADQAENRVQANAILSRYPIIDSRHTHIQSPVAGPRRYDQEGRVYLECDIHANEKPITIGTTHCSYTERFIETPAKDKEVEKLTNLLNMKHENFVFAGDMNAVPSSSYIKKLSQILNHISPDFDENTWTTKPFSYEGFEESALKWRLDYMFATPDIKPVRSAVINTPLSDHLPVMVEIEW